MGLLTDANLLAGMVDAVVMVVAAGKVSYKVLQKSVEALGRERIIGVVLNRAADAPFGTAYQYERVLRTAPPEILSQVTHVEHPDAAPDVALDDADWLRKPVDRAAPFRSASICASPASTPAAGLVPRVLLVIVVCQLCLYYRNLYEFRVLANRSELLIRVLQALGAASVILALLYLFVPSLIIARGVFVTSGLFVAAGVTSWRLGFEWISRRVAPRERLLLVGVGTASIALARELSERTERAIEVVGFVCPEADRDGGPRRQHHRDHRGHSGDRPRPRRRPRRRQPGRRAREAADGQAAGDEARRGDVRSPGLGVRAVHRTHRRREPATELADLLRRLPEERAGFARRSARST